MENTKKPYVTLSKNDIGYVIRIYYKGSRLPDTLQTHVQNLVDISLYLYSYLDELQKEGYTYE